MLKKILVSSYLRGTLGPIHNCDKKNIIGRKVKDVCINKKYCPLVNFPRLDSPSHEAGNHSSW